MKLKSLLLTLLVAGALAGVALVSQRTETTGMKMAGAAQKFLNSLTAEQKATTTFDFDSKERTYWNFVPMQNKKRQPTRKGLALKDMTDAQKKLAIDLLAASTSPSGKKKAIAIMALEGVLHELEKNRPRPGNVRSPEWYFVSIFGTPSKTGKWGWRLEGHHLSLNYTIQGGKVVSATPSFYGANPAVLTEKQIIKGFPAETLADVEKLARRLYASFDADQRKIAKQSVKKFPEPIQKSAYAKVGKAVGLPVAKMTKQQRKIVLQLLQTYANRMPSDIGRAQMQEVRTGGIGKIRFAYTGSAKSGEPHTYRIQGLRFVVEFLNEQGSPDGRPANHIHSVWRRIGGDFGLGAD